jgi:hypothetical protein
VFFGQHKPNFLLLMNDADFRATVIHQLKQKFSFVHWIHSQITKFQNVFGSPAKIEGAPFLAREFESPMGGDFVGPKKDGEVSKFGIQQLG